MRTWIAIPLIAVLAGCSLTPTLHTPPLPVPATFPSQGAGEEDSVTADIGWKTMFGDPRLQRLIELALRHNRDLRLAALNVEAVGAQYRIQRADQWPRVGVEASTVRERGGAVGQGGAQGTGQDAGVTTRHAVGLGISAFEIDLFGRLRSLSDAAFARYLVSEQGRLAAQLTLVGAVADAYFAERLAREQAVLAAQTLADWQQSLEIARLRSQAGQRSGIDVAQAEGQVASAQADVEARQRAEAQAGNALQLLVGVPLPADLPEGLPLSRPAVLTRLPTGLPSALLQVRPDIAQQEQRLRAANADIGAARAAFFPQLSLTASLGYASPTLGGLFDAGTRTWRFAPQITQPLFQAGRLRGELRLSEVRKSEAVAQYERAIQTAFREVADGLAGSATYERQIEAQGRVLRSAERRLELSDLRYRAGMDGRLELLDAQRQLYAARQTLLELRRAEIGNAVALYKALGGGLSDQGGSREPARPWGSVR